MSEQLEGDYAFAESFSRYRAYLSDICDVDYTCGREAGRGFGGHTPVFNDNVTVSVQTTPEMHKVDIAYARAGISDILGDDIGIMRVDNGKSSSLRFCLTLPRMSVGDVVASIQKLLDKYHRIKLCDIDFTIDCERITTRKDVEVWLPAGTKIADRRNKTGNNCISWYEEDGKRRCKEYNKTVQVLESAGAREKIGSSLHVLFTDTEVGSTAQEYKDSGVTRLEITFYSSELYRAEHYTTTVLDLYCRLRTCASYSVSLADQWCALSSKLTQMMCIYHTPTSTFAYCHWWNSLTGKIQGSSKTIKGKDLMKVLGNYSFVDRPVYLITVKGSPAREDIKVYRRASSDENITLVPGTNGGLYPSGKDKVRDLADYGMGVVEPGHLGWKDRLRSTSKALAVCEEEVMQEASIEDEINALMASMSKITINTKEYRPAHKTLVLDKVYTIMAFGKEVFHGKECVFARTTSGDAVRCEKSLARMILEHDASGVTYPLKIRTLRVVKHSNVPDLYCDVVHGDVSA